MFTRSMQYMRQEIGRIGYIFHGISSFLWISF